MNEELKSAPVGSALYFAEEKAPYRIKARSDRYLVCTKPFNLKKTVIYTVVDLEERIRGTENLVFGMGAETTEDCEEMVARLEGKRSPLNPAIPFDRTEVSHRNRIPLRVTRIVAT